MTTFRHTPVSTSPLASLRKHSSIGSSVSSLTWSCVKEKEQRWRDVDLIHEVTQPVNSSYFAVVN